MIYDAVLRAYTEKAQRDWSVLYVAVDLHGTIIERYTGDELKVYQDAEDTLKMLSKRSDIVLILYTSTYPENLKSFYDWCSQRGINFKYLNSNPECGNNKTGDFSNKFYFNLLLDDRAGFDPYSDWLEVVEAFKVIDGLVI
jgi:hypothetical protein